MKKFVPFLDLSRVHATLEQELEASFRRVLKSGRYIQGPEVDAFEQEFSRHVGSKYTIGVGNGLDALSLSLRAIGVGPGDEVIVPANTFIATWLAVTQVGATPVPIDPHPNYYTIQAGDASRAITKKTKAIIPVHLYGQPVNLNDFDTLADAHRISLIYDAAQAHGARCHGKDIGAQGDAVAWSFYPGKNLGCLGDGGAVTVNDGELAKKLRMLGNYGSQTKYCHEIIGVNSRLDEIQASALRIKLKALTEHNQKRRAVAEIYLSELDREKLVLPEVPSWAEPVWHLFVVQHPLRDRLREKLHDAGIETLIHYPTPPHLQPAYLSEKRFDLPIAERLSNTVLSLPMGPHLSEDDVSFVVETVNKTLRNL